MAKLEDLAQLAANVPLIGGVPLPELAQDMPVVTKRKRATKLEAARARVAKAQAAILTSEGKMSKLQNDTGLRTAPSKQKKLDEAIQTLSKHQAELVTAQDAVFQLEETARLSEEAAAAKKKQQDEKAENSKSLTEMATLLIVEIRLKYQARFDNSSDKNSAAWDHIHAEYIKKVEDNTLSESDRITKSQMERRWGYEYGEYKLWCAVANRAVNQSGLSADETEEKVSACPSP